MRTTTDESDFRWGQFLGERARLIRYFRDVEKQPWPVIARALSCDAEQVEMIYHGTAADRAKEVRP